MAAGHHGVAKLMFSYGGKIQRCSGGGQPRYVGGEHWTIGVSRSVSLRDLRHRLAALAGCSNISVKYALPGEGLDGALHDVVTDNDLRELLDWVLYRDLQIQLLGANPAEIPRVRVFVVRVDARLPPRVPAASARTASPSSSSAKSKDNNTPPSNKAPPSACPSLCRRSASAALLSAESTTGKTPPPSVLGRSASAPSLSNLSAKSTENDTASLGSATTTTAAVSTLAARGNVPVPDTVAFPAKQVISLVGPALVFFMPVAAPVVVYRPVIPVYQGFVLPVFGCGMVVLCGA